MPPHASGIPRSTSGIERYRVARRDPQIARGREHETAADAVTVDARDRDRVHRLDGVGHQAPEICVVTR